MNDYKQNALSFIGSTKRIMPLIEVTRPGWQRAGMWVLVSIMLVIAWVGVLLWYLTLTALPIMWVVWAIYTLNRRHHLYREETLTAIRQSA